MNVTVEQRLLSRVVKTETCWLWTGALSTERRYGIIGTDGHGKTARVHRVAYELWVGPIPSGAMVLHRCDVRNCVNPDHLYLGDAARNTLDMLERDRERRAECHPQAKLSVESITKAFLLRSQGWTQREIGHELGVTQSTLSRVLRGQAWKKEHRAGGRLEGIIEQRGMTGKIAA